MKEIIKGIGNSPIFIGVMILLMNLCSRHTMLDIPVQIQELMTNIWIRRIAVFSIVFISTRDVEASLIITLLFIIIFQYVFNNNSRVCILNSSQSTRISTSEYIAAKKIVNKYQKNS